MNLTTGSDVPSATSFLCGVELEQREFAAFQRLIYELTGISLSSAKHALVQSRLTKRLRTLQLNSFAEYLRLIENPRSPERELFINALTTNKTEFFREAHHFAFLRQRLFPEIRERARVTGERKLRLWCAASSSGEEPYSLAMTIMEEFGDEAGWDIKVLATDIDTNMLERASAGIYDALAIEYLADHYLKNYMEPRGEGSYAVNDSLKRLIVYRKLNLNQPPWPLQTKFDAIFCRNVMIYFDQATQHRLVERMTDLLLPGGYLMIGHSESLIGFPTRLESLGDTIYRIPSGRVIGTNVDERSRQVLVTERAAPALPTATASQSKTICAKKSTSPASAVDPGQLESNRINRVTEQSHPADSGTQRHLIVGEYYASAKPCRISTTLGSCIAACLFDPQSGVAGMNHFMLPESKLDPTISASYGVHAMELLINAMMKRGAHRDRLRAKIFGAASVIAGSHEIWNVGTKNANFVRNFLKTERIALDAEYLGGDKGMRIEFNTATFKVTVRLLDNTQAQEVFRQQAAACKQVAERLVATPPPSSITLF